MSIASLRFDAYVAGATDHPPLRAAQNQLATWLGAASGVAYTTELNWRDGDSLDPPSPGAFAGVISLIGDLARNVSFPEIVARRRLQLSSLAANSERPVFLCTIFRHVPGVPPRSESERGVILERIRRLNLMAAELSQTTGAHVIDIDRVFAFIGARSIDTDYLLRGRVAAAVAGDAIVSALLAAIGDEALPQGLWHKAQEMHGGIRGIAHRYGRFIQSSTPEVSRDGG